MKPLCSWKIRSTVLFSIAFLLGISAVSNVLAQRDNSHENSLASEHRLTRLETRVDRIAEDVQDLRLHSWVGLAGMAGLLGEAGRRVVREQRKKD